jgi:hypothetical protein
VAGIPVPVGRHQAKNSDVPINCAAAAAMK